MLIDILIFISTSILFHFCEYIFVGYDFQHRHSGHLHTGSKGFIVTPYRFAVIPPEKMGIWRHFCIYPKNGNHGGAYLLTYDIERFTICHLLIESLLVVLLSLLSSALCISPLGEFYIIMFGSELPFMCFLLVLYQLGMRIIALSEKPVVSEAEKKQHIRNCVRQYPKEQFSCEIREISKKSLLSQRTDYILYVANREAGEAVTSKTILREERYRYLHESITTFLGK